MDNTKYTTEHRKDQHLLLRKIPGVSTREQNEDRQLIALHEIGVEEKKYIHGQAVRQGF